MRTPTLKEISQTSGLIPICTFVISIIFNPLASAQKLEEIIVTAQKRAESLQDVSVSVTALSGEKLNDFGIARLEEITAYVPNFVMSETGIGTNIYIRGIGSGINQGFEQSVGMYRDGIYYGRAQLSRAPIFDMERVEVLRGPQVTLFGNNSIGGAISMTASSPTDEFEGSVSYLADFDHGEQETTLIFSGPLGDSFGARLSIRNYEMGGYIYNETLNQDEPKRDYLTTRLNLSFNSDDVTWMNGGLLLERSTFNINGRQIAIIEDNASGGFATSGSNYANGSRRETLGVLLSNLPSVGGETVLDANALETRYSNKDFSFNETRNATLTLNFNIGESELKSISGYLDYNYNDACDCDFTGAKLIQYEADEEYEQTSQEFRFTSPAGNKIDFIAGVYYQKDELLFNDALIAERGSALEDLVADVFGANFGTDLTDIAGPRNFKQDTELFSGFSQFTINFRDDLRLMAGVRRSKTEKEARRQLTFTQSDRVSPLTGTDGPPALDADNLFIKVRNAYNIGLLVSPHLEQGERTEWRTSYALILEWDINEDILLYGSRVRGFKSGGFDVRSNNPTDRSKIINNDGEFESVFGAPTAFTPGTFEFQDEEAIAHELGIKTSIGGVAEINASYFYTEIKDLQVSVFDGGVGFNVTNAAKAITQGIEIDVRAAITDKFTVNGSLGWLDFEFKEYTDAVCTADDRLSLLGFSGAEINETLLPGPDGFLGSDPLAPLFSGFDDGSIKELVNGNCTQINPVGLTAGQGDGGGTLYIADLTGSTNQYVSSYSGALSLNYEDEVFDDQYLFRGSFDMNFTGKYNPTQNLDPAAAQEGYEIYNVRLGLTSLKENWELVLIGRNIFNEQVISYANDVPLSSSQFGTVTKYGFIQRTKSWALQGRYNF